jgi:hypothetical protein
MNVDSSNIIDFALALPLSERLTLLNRLHESVVPPGVLCEDDPQASAELIRRIKNSNEPTIDGDEAMRRLWDAQRRRGGS